MESNISAIKALILDMDGVLWREDQPIGNLPHLFDQIFRKGLQVTLATNNATYSVEQYLEKLERFGVKLKTDQIVNSSLAAVYFLRGLFPDGGPIYVIGEEGLIETLQADGFYQSEGDVLAVIVGMDRKINYEKLSRATLLIRAGSLFIGTNADPTFPVPEGLIPGVGAILAALEVASGVHPHVVGKPQPEMYRVAMDRMNTKPKETLIVGDRLETDILGGQKLGCPTALVLSGVTSRGMLQSWKPKPDFVVDNLETLIDLL